VPILALTATATARVAEATVEALGLRQTLEIRASLNRRNLRRAFI
jgi:superfamily II DNA helicase RecQ